MFISCPCKLSAYLFNIFGQTQRNSLLKDKQVLFRKRNPRIPILHLASGPHCSKEVYCLPGIKKMVTKVSVSLVKTRFHC